MRAAVTRLDPGALSSATACFTASLRSCRVWSCTDLHSSGTPQGMWARTSRSKAGKFSGLLAYSASQYLWTSPMTSEASMTTFSDSRTRTNHRPDGA